jgi:hypothetical protein
MKASAVSKGETYNEKVGLKRCVMDDPTASNGRLIMKKLFLTGIAALFLASRLPRT